MDDDQYEPIQILLLGDPDVGKSAFLSRLTLPQNTPLSTPLPTLRDSNQPFTFDIRTSTRSYRLEFYDTSSPEHYTLLRPHILVLVFSVADRATLRAAQTTWKHAVETHFNYDEHMPVLLLGLKRDLRREGDPKVVFPYEGLNCAQEMRCDRYAECSAVTGELVPLVFEDIVRMAKGTTTEGGGKSEGPPCAIM